MHSKFNVQLNSQRSIQHSTRIIWNSQLQIYNNVKLTQNQKLVYNSLNTHSKLLHTPKFTLNPKLTQRLHNLRLNSQFKIKISLKIQCPTKYSTFDPKLDSKFETFNSKFITMQNSHKTKNSFIIRSILTQNFYTVQNSH